ncbi:molybdate transport system regulatory protein [Sphaerotilus hippei]|uniref:Molybdate transport system regulatory protein n=1 Tax=Sphaerotilus hippei TaxID=744406 RepID=A0A318GX97_9BURK|nr:TOBE domain-containing protein [Sphaerotilus hippei]PXW94314.1 molybdate transport system regulatory protein [Sphaerotilus hippei]
MVSPRRSPPPPQPLKGRLALETPLGAVLSDKRIRLLEAIDRCGSLNRAAPEVPLSYKAAWDTMDAMNKLAPEPLVVRCTGGSGGGGTQLTDYARQLISLYRAMESSQQDVLDRLPSVPAEGDAPALRTLIRRMTMKTSARNQFPAHVTGLADGGGMVEVTLRLGEAEAPGEAMVAAITPESVEGMALTLGSELFVLVKAPAVQVMAAAPRRAAGRNVLTGTITALRPGSHHTGVTLALPSGHLLQAVVDDTQAGLLAPGQAAWALFDSDHLVLVTFG